MKLGLLACDHVGPDLVHIAGDYEEMFRRLFAPFPEVEVIAYDVVGGHLPAAPDQCDAWITTGSRYSVNDDETWIRELEDFVRRVADRGVPFVGVCFGHQLLAKALGGRVVRSQRGWGVGVKEVEVGEGVGLGGGYRLLNSHQDQVETLPPGGAVLGWSQHCPVSMLAVGETMIGIQGHPEFEPEYFSALIRSRRGTVIPEVAVDLGLGSLGQGANSDRVAAWIVDFFHRAATAPATGGDGE